LFYLKQFNEILALYEMYSNYRKTESIRLKWEKKLAAWSFLWNRKSSSWRDLFSDNFL